MIFEYIRRLFDSSPARKGDRVLWIDPNFGKALQGTILSVDRHVHVRFDDGELVHTFDPRDPALIYEKTSA
jgi:hypothetical protein